MELESLASQQLESYTEFKNIAGIESDDDASKIVRLLEINDFNLNNAVLNYFDSGFESIERQSTAVEVHDDANELHHRRRGADYVNLANSFELHDLIPKLPFAPRIDNNWQIGVGIHKSLRDTRKEASTASEALRKTLGTIWFVILLIPKGVVSILYSVLRLLFRINLSGTNDFSYKFDYDKLDLDYTPATDPCIESDALARINLAAADFNDTHEQSKTNYAPLLVVLLDDSDRSYDFINTLIRNDNFAGLFDKDSGKYKDTRVFINNVNRSYESFEVARTYRIRRVPYVMLIANVTNNPAVMASMSVVYKSNISAAFLDSANIARTCAKVLDSVNKVLSTYDAQLVAARYDKQEIEFSRMLKQKQDDAYLKSLEMDKVKKQEKVQKERQQNLVKLRNQFKLHLWRSKWFEELNGEANCRIAIKLPNGKRLVEKVHSGITLRDLYLYIEVVLHCHEGIERMGEAEFEQACSQLAHDVEEFGFNTFFDNFKFTFELVQPFPKKVFDGYDMTLQEAGLHNGASLLVEYIEESDEDQ